MDNTHHQMSFDTTYRIMRVNRKTGLETDTVHTALTGGSITRNQDTAITEQATLDIEGTALFGSDLLRIWADLDYADGTTESIPLGTFLPDGPKRQITGGETNRTPLNLYGRLRELDDDQFTQPVALATGANPMTWIESTCTAAGLEIAPHDECTYRMGAAWTFGIGDQKDKSKLDAINALLDLIGWQSARTDPYGRILLQPYTPPNERSPIWTFTEGPGARFLRDMTDERDWFDTANQVRVIYSHQDKEITGIATDNDPNSEFSTIRRGRTIGKTYTYNDIPEGKTDTQLTALANAKAQELLTTSQSVIHRITMTHIYAPITIGDLIHLDYPTGGISGDFAIRTQKIRLDAGLPIEAECRQFERTTNGS